MFRFELQRHRGDRRTPFRRDRWRYEIPDDHAYHHKELL